MPLLTVFPSIDFQFEEVIQIDPEKKLVMMWNGNIYEYDYLVLANGKNVFGHDFDVEEAVSDIELFENYFPTAKVCDPTIQNKKVEMEDNLSNNYCLIFVIIN